MDVRRYAAACQTALPNPLSRRDMGPNTDRMLAMIDAAKYQGAVSYAHK